MSFILFLFALLCMAIAINVIQPVYRYPKGIVPSFIAGWLAGELAMHVIAAELLILMLVVFFGELSGFWDGISLALVTLSWGMLAYHYFSGYKAKFIMDTIVTPHRSKEDVSDWVQHTPFNIRRLTLPFSHLKDPDIQVEKNIVYEEVDGFRLKLDIRRSRIEKENCPVLLQIHGGAWTHGYGSKNEQAIPLMIEMAKRGWISVSVDYRLSPKAKMPEHIIDCKKALIWIKENIKNYGGDPNFIIATGGSAGGHLSSLLALSSKDSSLQPGFEDKDTSVQGCVPFYGIYDLLDSEGLQMSKGIEIILRKNVVQKTKQQDEALYRQMSPVHHVHADAPPFLIVHGDKDSLTSLGEAQYFASQLDQISAKSVEFAEIAGAQHGFDTFPSIRSDYVMLGVAERICQWHKQYKDQLSAE